MKVTFTYQIEVPEKATKQQVEEWLEFEINSGCVDKGNPLIDNNHQIEKMSWDNLIETEIEE